MDVAAIAVGTDFVDQVESAISTSDVSLVVIGPEWLRATDAEGRQRLDDPEDHVTAEVRSALASAKLSCRYWWVERPCLPRAISPTT
jgi:hypothetical protein